MAGLYFHIPFCKRICAYCDFFRSASLHLKEGVVSAMHDELREEHSFISDRDVRTIYFGGGTPSLLAPVEFQRFIDDADRYFSLSDVGEITIEANPDDIDAKYVAELRRTAVNRVSLGVQSFNDAELRFMNRRHNAEEAVAAWKIALEEHRPVGLIFSRQDVPSLPSHKARIDEAMQAYKGAYVVFDSANPDVVMVGSGSDVSTLVAGAELLQKDGVAVRVVSAPSEGLFRDQPKSYQQSILLKDVPRYGLTSGLSMTLRGLVGEGGKIHGLDHFGYSAPYKVLDEKFGYNGQAVYEEVKAMLCKE